MSDPSRLAFPLDQTMRINLQRTTHDVAENGDYRRRGFHVFVGLVVSFVSSISIAQDTPDYYRQNCMNCHTIGSGRLFAAHCWTCEDRHAPITRILLTPEKASSRTPNPVSAGSAPVARAARDTHLWVRKLPGEPVC